jgi:hypothetical protein
MVWSSSTIEVEIGREFTDTGEMLQKEIIEFAWLRPPLLDSFQLDDHHVRAHLLDALLSSRVVLVDG